jgi:hypothetical protein
MLAMAVVAVTIAAESMRRRAADYRAIAERHAAIEEETRDMADWVDEEVMTPEGAASARELRKMAEHFGRLRRRYEYAASHPWLSVPPDPPEPEWPRT